MTETEILKQKLRIATMALEDIRKWDDDLEDEWQDQGYRAKDALEKLALIDHINH